LLVVLFPRAAVPQDLPDQEEAGEEAAPEPPHPLLDPHAHRQHHQVLTGRAHPRTLLTRCSSIQRARGESNPFPVRPVPFQVQREAQALAPHQARVLSVGKLGFKSCIFLLFRACLGVCASLEVIPGCF
jgi:hypothetical protein